MAVKVGTLTPRRLPTTTTCLSSQLRMGSRWTSRGLTPLWPKACLGGSLVNDDDASCARRRAARWRGHRGRGSAHLYPRRQEEESLAHVPGRGHHNEHCG